MNFFCSSCSDVSDRIFQTAPLPPGGKRHLSVSSLPFPVYPPGLGCSRWQRSLLSTPPPTSPPRPYLTAFFICLNFASRGRPLRRCGFWIGSSFYPPRRLVRASLLFTGASFFFFLGGAFSSCVPRGMLAFLCAVPSKIFFFFGFFFPLLPDRRLFHCGFTFLPFRFSFRLFFNSEPTFWTHNFALCRCFSSPRVFPFFRSSFSLDESKSRTPLVFPSVHVDFSRPKSFLPKVPLLSILPRSPGCPVPPQGFFSWIRDSTLPHRFSPQCFATGFLSCRRCHPARRS